MGENLKSQMDNLTLISDLWGYFSLVLEFGLFDVSTTKFGLKIIDPYFQNLGQVRH